MTLISVIEISIVWFCGCIFGIWATFKSAPKEVWLRIAIGARLQTLLDEEGDILTLSSDNPESIGPRQAIICRGGWTDWKDKHFGGDSLLECLDNAVITRIGNVESKENLWNL